MAKSKLELDPYEELFKPTSVQNGQKSGIELDINDLQAFNNHPFRLQGEEAMAELVESIVENGVFQPILVRESTERGYEILAGHNRVEASKRAGKTRVPAIVLKVDDDKATMIMTDSNLKQRREFLPSELAFAYQMQMEVLRRQGRRSDLTSVQNGQKSTSVEEVAERNETSTRQIKQYVRLTKLTNELLDMVDHKKLKVIAGAELSYLSEFGQKKVYELLQTKGYSLNPSKLETLKRQSKDEGLTEQLIKVIMSDVVEVKPKQITRKELVREYELPEKKADMIIQKALEAFCQTEEYQKIISEG